MIQELSQKYRQLKFQLKNTLNAISQKESIETKQVYRLRTSATLLGESNPNLKDQWTRNNRKTNKKWRI